jgi:uncharacterized protein (DUF2141 family)
LQPFHRLSSQKETIMREHLGNILKIAIMLAMPAAGSLSFAAAAELDVVVHVVGIEKPSGAVYGGLYDAKGWKDGHFVSAVDVPVTGKVATLHLTVPAPAIMPSGCSMTSTAMGSWTRTSSALPKNFSNNATGSMGPPDFSAAAFDLTSDGAKQEIHMQ